MKRGIAIWCLAILATIGITIGLLWKNYEPYEEVVQFNHSFENRLKGEFFGNNRHVYFIPVKIGKELAEDSEDLVAMSNILNIGTGEPIQKVTLHSTTSQELVISGISPIGRVGVFVFVQESTDAYGNANGVARIYAAPMKKTNAFVTYKEDYPLPGHISEWSAKSFSHESVVFKYDNRGTIVTFTVVTPFFVLLASFAGLIIYMIVGMIVETCKNSRRNITAE